MQHPYALVIGGSSGLGLELAVRYARSHRVIITGRRDPQRAPLAFRHLDLDATSLGSLLDRFVTELPPIDVLIYAAGFYQEGPLSDLRDADITAMHNVGLLAPTLLLQRLLKRQSSLPGLIAITSTSQWTPRRLEPVYTAVKAGLGMLANSLALDERIGKVLVVGPGGMHTQFWARAKAPPQDLLDPHWVAEQIDHAFRTDYAYQCIRLLRNPPRIEIVETRVH